MSQVGLNGSDGVVCSQRVAKSTRDADGSGVLSARSTWVIEFGASLWMDEAGTIYLLCTLTGSHDLGRCQP